MNSWKALAEADEAEGTVLQEALADSHLDWKAAAPIDLMELMMHLSFEPQQKFLAAQVNIQLAKILELHWLEKGLGHGNGSKDDDIDFAWVEWAEILSKHADLDRNWLLTQSHAKPADQTGSTCSLAATRAMVVVSPCCRR